MMKQLIAIFALVLWLGDSFAQDPHLSMYHTQPLLMNPANAGNMSSKWRFFNTYREQNAAISRPFRSLASSLDVNLPINAWAGNIWGVGFSAFNDDMADSKLMNRRYNLSFSLGQYLDSRNAHSLAVGFQAGLGQRGIVYDDVYWESQWVGDGFGLYIDSGEPMIDEVRSYFDVSTGIRYAYDDQDMVRYEAGIGMFHFNNPDYGLTRDTNGTLLDQKWTVHMTLEHGIRKNSMFILRPSFLWTTQGQHRYLIFGSDYEFLFSEGTRTTGKRKRSSLVLGTYHRWDEALIGKFQLNLAGISIGASYDLTIGSLNKLNGWFGGPEFFFGYQAGLNKGLFNGYSKYKKGKL